MKIPSPARHLRQAPEQRRQVRQPCGDHVAHVALALPASLHGQKPGVQQRRALAFAHLPTHDHLHTGFIFQRNEDHALGRLGLLAQRDEAAAAPADGAAAGARLGEGRGVGVGLMSTAYLYSI